MKVDSQALVLNSGWWLCARLSSVSDIPLCLMNCDSFTSCCSQPSSCYYTSHSTRDPGLSGEGEGQAGDVGLDLDLADASASSASAPGQALPKDGAPAPAIAGGCCLPCMCPGHCMTSLQSRCLAYPEECDCMFVVKD